MTKFDFATVALAFVLCACAPAPPSASSPQDTPPPLELPRPNVRMEADPPPSFTYWAPEGAVITNHPHVPGVWFADLEGRRVASYFGDECRASEFQHFVGQPIQSFPAPPAGIEVRTSCTMCEVNADLRRNRINVLFNEATQVIEQLACY